MRLAGLLLLPCVLAGCTFVAWHTIDHPGVSQSIRVESGDRYFMDLEENATTGYRWDFTSDDPDVEVTIDHVAGDAKDGAVGVSGKAKVTIRIHRGYDGPSAVTFAYKRPWEKAPIKSFTIAFYKRTGDCAFWE